MLAGADVQREDPLDRCFPLHTTVSGGQDALVGDLLSLPRGACPNALDESDLTPLHLAAELGHESVVTMILDSVHTTVFDVVDDEGLSPLMEASKGGHVSIVRALLAAGADCSPRA